MATKIPFNYIYRADWVSWYDMVFKITNIIGCVLYPVMSYIVIRKTPQSFGGYKWLIWITITSTFFFDVANYIFHPIYLLPFQIGKFYVGNQLSGESNV